MGRFQRRPRRRGCGCPNQIVYPTKYDTVHNCFETEVDHIHPSHTTVMNHHLIKNKHIYPHSTSVQNTYDSVNMYGGSFEVPNPGPGFVAGAMSPGGSGAVAGAMYPGGGPGMGQMGGMGAGYGHCYSPCKKRR